jgi:hypothetical protein
MSGAHSLLSSPEKQSQLKGMGAAPRFRLRRKYLEIHNESVSRFGGGDSLNVYFESW